MKGGDLVRIISVGDSYISGYPIGIILRQIDCEMYEVLVGDKVMIIDDSTLTEVKDNGRN
jgi:hypothetical protein